jgi:hypothetical protein
MKRTFRLSTIAAVVILLAGAAAAQSLADVARKTRKEHAHKTPAKVFTNDNLPTDAPVSVMGQPAAPSAQPGDSTAPKQGAAASNPDDNKTPTQKRDEAMQQWKKRFAEQKNKISLLQRELDVLQGEYRLRAAAYYADAGNALRNQGTWAQQDREYREKLDLKQKQLDQAKQQLEDMQEDARKAGMPTSVSE